MNSRPTNISRVRTSRAFWPLALSLSGPAVPGLTVEHMQLAREMIEDSGVQAARRTSAGSTLWGRVTDVLLRGLKTAGKAHAEARALMLH